MRAFRLAIYSLVALLVLGTAGAVWAQVSPPAHVPQQAYDLSWHTVDGGGHTWSTGGTYVLGGTIGQHDAGSLAGDTYTLGGGFWEGGALAEILHRVYLPLVQRAYTP